MKLIYKILFFVCLVGVFLLLNLPLNEPVEFNKVNKVLEDKQKLKEKVKEAFSHDDFYTRPLRYLTQEKKIKVSGVLNTTSTLDKILSRRSYDLILNEGNDAEYLIEIVIFRNLDYEVKSFYLRLV